MPPIIRVTNTSRTTMRLTNTSLKRMSTARIVNMTTVLSTTTVMITAMTAMGMITTTMITTGTTITATITMGIATTTHLQSRRPSRSGVPSRCAAWIAPRKLRS